MAGIDFYPPSYRAAASDLTVAISPLGLVELADEEFEVHGPRLNRYASNWAWYLGHHYAYRREIGDNNLVFNYCRAFGDYIINFNFGKGINFHCPEATGAIIPYLLKKVWDEDNIRQSVLYEIGQYGTVSGDVFVKIAYEEPFQDPNGIPVPGKIRILPLNPAFCFPTWHPHDKTRMVEFKLKYKFWGTAADGTRSINTYVEVITEQLIREYINDELLDERPNMLGTIPVAYCPNIMVASSPWGLADIQEIVPLNREFNEKATEISDIINYHAAPVTVIVGGKASNLEKGPRKIWSIGNKDARIENLQLDTNLQGPLGFMEFLKQSMHELTGVPAQALGTMQPISNTSGVALHMQYQPIMQKHQQKKVLYTPLFKRINELIIKYAALFEPEWLKFNPLNSSIQPQPDQYLALDPMDPVTYRTSVNWPDPLPVDILFKINEVQAKMALGLESRAGAMRDLGEQFPEQKLQQIFEEQMEDTKMQASLDLIKAQAGQFTMQATGMTPDGQPLIIPGTQQTDAEGNPTGMAPQVDPNLANELMYRAYQPLPPERMDFDETDE
jgi:hypothetical protein